MTGEARFALRFAAMLVDGDASAEILMLDHAPTCPFCGDSHPIVHAHSTGCAVVCLQCGAHGPATGSPAEAVQQWTRRPATAAAPDNGRRACPHCAATEGLRVRQGCAPNTVALGCGRCAAQGPVVEHNHAAFAKFAAMTRWNERAADYHDQGFDDFAEGAHG